MQWKQKTKTSHDHDAEDAVRNAIKRIKSNEAVIVKYLITMICSFVAIVVWAIWGSYYRLIRTSQEGKDWMEKVLNPGPVQEEEEAASEASKPVQAGGGDEDVLGIKKFTRNVLQAILPQLIRNIESGSFWQYINPFLAVAWVISATFKGLFGLIQMVIKIVSYIITKNISEVIKTAVDTAAKKAFVSDTKSNNKHALQLLGPIAMLFYAILGFVSAIFESGKALFNPKKGIWTFDDIISKLNVGDSFLKPIAKILLCIGTFLLVISLGFSQTVLRSASYTLKYLLSGIFLLPETRKPAFREWREIFLDVTKITLSLAWILAVIGLPAWYMTVPKEKMIPEVGVPIMIISCVILAIGIKMGSSAKSETNMELLPVE